jgi:predicted MPP superfamily phosphohydrolase
MLDQFLHFLRTPDWRRQHRWRRAIWMNMHRVGLTGMHALPVNRRWVDIHRTAMPLVGLDPAFEGMKIVQVSDLHYSPVVFKRYLAQYVEFINELKADLVVVTGDLITGGYRYARRISGILGKLEASSGVICTLGNHDYGMHGRRTNGNGRRMADVMTEGLRARGLLVLRNQTYYLKARGAKRPVAVVGLDDEWSGAIDPDAAFTGVDTQLPIICLNHNPANVRQLLSYPWQWMLSGHTHGRAVATSAIGKRLYPKRYRHYTHGHYTVEGRHLYVNRGLSYGRRRLEWCRPEITVFRLEAAAVESNMKSPKDTAL